MAVQAELYLQRAMAHLSNNALEAALADCEQALRLNPALAQAYCYRGWPARSWGIRQAL